MGKGCQLIVDITEQTAEVVEQLRTMWPEVSQRDSRNEIYEPHEMIGAALDQHTVKTRDSSILCTDVNHGTTLQIEDLTFLITIGNLQREQLVVISSKEEILIAFAR